MPSENELAQQRVRIIWYTYFLFLLSCFSNLSGVETNHFMNCLFLSSLLSKPLKVPKDTQILEMEAKASMSSHGEKRRCNKSLDCRRSHPKVYDSKRQYLLRFTANQGSFSITSCNCRSRSSSRSGQSASRLVRDMERDLEKGG